ncbi:MAG: hypothetical protein PHD95_01290 [Candidatus ainarchaeum sp.]|nr:hypothetical protein [Candidatus ainarchaeum sp.]
MKKAQLLSMDLVIALIAVVFSIGLLIQFNETMIYSQKEKTLQNELEGIGKTASTMLVGNPSIICELVDSTIPPSQIGYLENCIDSTGNYSKITATNLEIPTGPGQYDFAVYKAGAKIAGTDLPISPNPVPADIYSEKRIVVISNGPVQKQGLEICKGNSVGNCPMSQTELSIYVWRV